jgi:hypothetical protein
MPIIVYYPKLSVANYKTLRSEPDLNLPDTYDKWLDFSAKQMREIRLSGDATLKICEIKIDPDEFARYCQSPRQTRTFDALRKFATEKGGGKS